MPHWSERIFGIARPFLAVLILVRLSCGRDRAPTRPGTTTTRLVGRVLDTAGEPETGVVVVLMPDPVAVADGTKIGVMTDSAGVFSFVTTPGLWILYAAPGPYLSGRLHVEIPDPPPPETSVDLPLIASGALRGHALLAGAGTHEETAVTVAGDDSIEAVTSAEGAFLLDRVPLGHRVIRFEHDGYVPANLEVDLTVMGDTVDVQPLVLAPASVEGAVVTGFVRIDGRPTAGITVTLEGPLGETSRPGAVATRETLTDVAGSYFFDGVSPGSYDVEATREFHLGSRNRIVVTGSDYGKTVRADLTLVPVAAIVGRIEMSGGGEPEGVEVRLLENGASVVTGSSGMFAFLNLTIGSWTLDCAKTGYIPRTVTTTLTAAGEIDSLPPIVMHPGMRVACFDFVNVVADTILPPSVISAPWAIDVGPDGTVFVVDSFWGRVQRFDATGRFLGYWTLSVRGLAVEAGGTFLTSSGNRVYRRAGDGSAIRSFTSVGTPPYPGKVDFPFFPVRLAVDEAGYIYANDGNGKVHKFTPEGVPYRYPNVYGPYDTARPIAATQDRVYLQAYDRNSTLVRDSTLAAAGSIPGSVRALGDDGAGGVFIAGTDGRIRHVDRAGSLAGEFGASGSGRGEFRDVTDLALGPDGLLYVADYGNARIQVIRTDGGFVQEWRGNAFHDNIRVPQHVAVAPDGEIYISNEGNGTISRFGPDGRFISSASVGDANLPRGLSIGPDGTVWVMVLYGYYDGALRRLDRDLRKLQSLTPNFGDRDYTGPGSYGLFSDAANRVYVCDEEGARVLKFVDRALATEWGGRGSADGQFERPRCVTTTPDDATVLVTDGQLNRIQVFSSSGAWIRTFGSTGSDAGQMLRPAGIAVDRRGHVYVADIGNRRIEIFTLQGQYLGEFTGGPGEDPFVSPVGLGMDPGRRYLHVVDSGSETIRIYDVLAENCLP